MFEVKHKRFKCRAKILSLPIFIVDISLDAVVIRMSILSFHIVPSLFTTVAVPFLHPVCLLAALNHKIRKTAHVRGSPEEFSWYSQCSNFHFISNTVSGFLWKAQLTFTPPPLSPPPVTPLSFLFLRLEISSAARTAKETRKKAENVKGKSKGHAAK